MSERQEKAKSNTEVAFDRLTCFFDSIPEPADDLGNKRMEFPPSSFGESYIKISKEGADAFTVDVNDSLWWVMTFSLDREGLKSLDAKSIGRFRFSVTREGLEEAIRPTRSGQRVLSFGYEEFLKLSTPLVRGTITSYMDGHVGGFGFHAESIAYLIRLSELQEVSKLAKAA